MCRFSPSVEGILRGGHRPVILAGRSGRERVSCRPGAEQGGHHTPVAASAPHPEQGGQLAFDEPSRFCFQPST